MTPHLSLSDTVRIEMTPSQDIAGGEKVMVTLNVNHTVDSAQPDDGSEEVSVQDLLL